MSDLLLSLLAAVLAITLHEAAHGYAALWLGDDTAKLQGRLSLNPLRHVDRIGTVILPAVLVIGQLLTIGRVGFMFGWAKPVPVSAWRFRNPRQGMAIVAAAGPAMNFLLAWLTGLALHAQDSLPDWASPLFEDFSLYFMMTNLVLGLFNLLPIPPLDGGRIVVGILPEKLAFAWARLERAGIVLVLFFVFLLPQALREFAHIQFDPVGQALNRLLPRAIEWILLASGHSQL